MSDKKNSSNVIYGAKASSQIIDEDRLFGDLITPFFDPKKIMMFYYANVYHRLCINIKSRILSMVEDTDIDKYLVGITPRRFLKKCILDGEMFGNMFVEEAGSGKYKALYHLPAKEARIGKNYKIYQVSGFKKQEINAYHLGYESVASRFYGEPDYLASINQILVSENIDLYNANFFKNGAVPRLAVSFINAEVSDEQMDSLNSFFGSTYKGVDNAHRTLILSVPPNIDGKDADIKYEKLSQSDDLSYEKLKNLNRDDIVASHGVPPRLVGIVNSGGWGGSGEFMGQLHSFNEIHIKPKQEEIEEFFRSMGVKLTLKPLDVTNFKDDSEVMPSLIQSGILTVAEARNILGWSKNV
ncbi:MAG: phage portal protein [Campylobacteraceae bacterium]